MSSLAWEISNVVTVASYIAIALTLLVCLARVGPSKIPGGLLAALLLAGAFIGMCAVDHIVNAHTENMTPLKILVHGLEAAVSLPFAVLIVLGNKQCVKFIIKAGDADDKYDNKLYRTAFYRARIGMALVRMDGTIEDCNEALGQMLGFTRDELTSGRVTFLDVTHPEDAAADAEHFERMVSGEIDGYQLEKRYKKYDQSYFWGRLNVARVTENLALEYVVGQVEDIDELKRALAKLERQYSHTRKTLDAVMDDRTAQLEERIRNRSPELMS